MRPDRSAARQTGRHAYISQPISREVVNPLPFTTIAVYSLKGGVGRTTLTANIGVELVRLGVKVMLVDADHQNCLGLHLGMEVGEHFGHARPEATLGEVEDYNDMLGSRTGLLVPHIPFGHCTVEQAIEIERQSTDDPQIIERRLRTLVPPETQLVMVDCQPGLSAWTRRIVSLADRVLVVLTPDASSYVTLPMLRDLLQGHARGPVDFVINNYDSRWPLPRDVRGALGNALGEQLYPWAVPFEPAIQEALAKRRLLPEMAPDVQAVTAFRNIASHIADQLRIRGEA